MLPADPFGRCPGTTRLALVGLLVEAQQELITDERAALRRLGHAIAKYLAGDAHSIEHALGIQTPPGSHLTPVALARRIRKTG